METRIVSTTNLEQCEFIENKHIELGYYSQQCPDKNTPNEDSLGFYLEGKKAVLAVADGVGGYPNGEVASSLIISAIINQFKKNNPNNLTDAREIILSAIEQSNHKLIHDYVGGKTTLTLCVIINDILQSFQIGDSCLIVCGQKGLLKHKPLEHSPVGMAVAAKLISEKAALTHPERHIISNVVGDAHMHIEMGPQIALGDFDTVLLASDGLSDNLTTQQLIELVRKESIDEVMHKLTDYAQQMRDPTKAQKINKMDDVSFIICRQKHSS